MNKSQMTNFQRKPYTFTPVVDTAIYASGDVLFAPTAVPIVSDLQADGAVRIVIDSIIVRDFRNQKAAFDLVFFTAQPSAFGAVNAPCALATLADLALVARVINVPAANYVELKAASNSIAQPAFVSDNFEIELPAGQKNLYVAAIVRGTPTYGAATDLSISIGAELQSIAMMT